MRDRFISINGLRFHYIEWGDPRDPPLVLLHGGTAHAHWWRLFVDALGGGHRVLALDLRGHGDSEWADPLHYNIATHAADLAAFLEALDLRDVTLVGHSYGGFVAMFYAGGEEERLARLVVIDIRPRLTQSAARYLRAIRVLPRPTYKSLKEAVGGFQLLPRENGAKPEILAQLARQSFRQLNDGSWVAKFDRHAMGRAEPYDFTGAIRKLRCPMLFVRGEDSQALPPAGIAEIKAAAPHAVVVTISNSHHHLMLDQPEALAEVVGNFSRDEPDEPGDTREHRGRVKLGSE